LTCLVDRRWTKSCLVDYYPESSAVVRCLDDDNRTIAYAKVHAGDEGHRTFRMQNAFWEAARGSRLRIARPLVYSVVHRTLLVETVVGQTIGELGGAAMPAGLHAYGAALATLHSLPLVDLALPADSALDRLEEREEGMRAVLPDAGESASVLLGELGERWKDAAGEPVLVHGDTNENNAILQNGRVAFIDFDRAAIGSAGSDVGNFLGLLRYFRSLGLISSDTERARTTAFVRGYSSVRPLPPSDTLRVHEAAALVERAFRAVTRLHKRALPRVPDLLSEARSLLRAGALR
jgi:Ser/Thr protein kinase RdoA (MazF antagonist)